MSVPTSETTDTVRVVIADDEPFARVAIRAVLDGMEGLEVIQECADGRETLAAVREHAPGLLLLDIQMPELSGFEVLEALHEDEVPDVIFITAHDEFALEAFRVHALDYVLKPFDDDRLEDAVEVARRRMGTDRERRLERVAAAISDLRSLASTADVPVPPKDRYATRFMVREESRVRFVAADDVRWFEADGNYVKLHTDTGAHRVRSSVEDLAGRLDPKRFARIHRRLIVNIDCVAEAHPWVGGDYHIVLDNGESLRVSRRYKRNLLRPLS